MSPETTSSSGTCVGRRSQHVAARLHAGTERCYRHLRAALSLVADTDHQDNGPDDDGIGPLARRCGDPSREDQQEKQGAPDLLPKDAHPRKGLLFLELVSAKPTKAIRSRGGRQTLIGGV